MPLSRLFRTSGSSASSHQKTGWIGIDIGTSVIKIAQLQRVGGRVRLAHSLVIRAEDGQPFDLASFESGRVGREIRNALQIHRGFRGRDAAVLVSLSHCELRTLAGAGGTDEEQRELISLELECDVNSSGEPREFEYWSASAPEQGEHRSPSQIHVLSVPQTLSDTIANNLLRAGLQCRILDAVPFAAARATEMVSPMASSGSHHHSTAVLDWGHSAATLLIVHHGQPFMTRVLKHCGLSRVLQAVCHRLTLTETEAEAMLTEYGVSKTLAASGDAARLQSLITELCSHVIADLTEEILETLSFLKTQFPQQTPGQLCLMGGGAAIRGIATLMQQQIRMPVGAWDLRGSSAEHVSPVLATSAALSALAWEL